jgi:RNA polymerase sigma-70 factor (ECF subfamily)
MTYAQLVKMKDEALMEQLQHGHNDALAVLFDRYSRLVVNIALRILRDSGEAEDLMQSVFLEIFRASSQFDPAKGSAKLWLLQYAYHRSFNRRSHLALRGLYDDRDTNATSGSGDFVSLLNMESSHLVREALGSLKGRERQVLEMAFYEGLTMREISEKINETFDSVRHNYYRGIEKLRALLCEKPKARMESGVRVPHAEP